MVSLGLEVTPEPEPEGTAAQRTAAFLDGLKSGTTLCHLANAMQPGVVPKINKMSQPFMQRENVSFFLKACVPQSTSRKSFPTFVNFRQQTTN